MGPSTLPCVSSQCLYRPWPSASLLLSYLLILVSEKPGGLEAGAVLELGLPCALSISSMGLWGPQPTCSFGGDAEGRHNPGINCAGHVEAA